MLSQFELDIEGLNYFTEFITNWGRGFGQLGYLPDRESLMKDAVELRYGKFRNQ